MKVFDGIERQSNWISGNKKLRCGVKSVDTSCQMWHNWKCDGLLQAPVLGRFKSGGFERIPSGGERGSRLCSASRAGGGGHPSAKPLKGFGGASTLEVVSDFDGDTFRAVYTVKFKGAVYALHAFQKKSKKGIATPTKEIELIKDRLNAAEDHYSKWSKSNAKKNT